MQTVNQSLSQDMPEYVLLEKYLCNFTDVYKANRLSHELLLEYNNIATILETPPEKLAEFSGMNQQCLNGLTILLPFVRAYERDKASTVPEIQSFDDIGKFIVKRFFGYKNEMVGVMLLDSGGNVITFDFLEEGFKDSVGLSIKKLMAFCIDNEAGSFVLSHNHPNGTALPSKADVCLTEQLANFFRNTNVHFIDHIIVANGDYISMAQSGEYTHIFKRSE